MAREHRALHASAVRDIHERLSEVPRISPGPAPEWLVESMHELFGCRVFAANRPAKDAAGVWRLGEIISTDARLFAAYDAEMHRTTTSFHYDPLHPEREHRGRVRKLCEVHRHPPDQTCVVEDVMPLVGLQGYDQLRTLVCEGSTLLSWVGGFRAEPFTERERRLFTALVPMLKRALAFYRRLADAGLGSNEMSLVLEAIAAPAFIASRKGAIDHANGAARALLDNKGSDTRARVRDAIARPREASFVARMGPPSATSECFLVVLRDDEALLDARLCEASRNWKVTSREREVLRLVVSGDANKEIAIKLAVHEGSVERHVTALLRKARCDSRSRLVARFWTRL